MIGTRAHFGHFDHRHDEVVAVTATNTTARQADNVVVFSLNQISVDWQFTKFIDEYRKAFAVGIAKQMVDQRCFAGAEITTNYGDRCYNLLAHLQISGGKYASVLNRAPNPNVFQFVAADFFGVVFKNGKVGPLANFN